MNISQSPIIKSVNIKSTLTKKNTKTTFELFLTPLKQSFV